MKTRFSLFQTKNCIKQYVENELSIINKLDLQKLYPVWIQDNNACVCVCVCMRERENILNTLKNTFLQYMLWLRSYSEHFICFSLWSLSTPTPYLILSSNKVMHKIFIPYVGISSSFDSLFCAIVRGMAFMYTLNIFWKHFFSQSKRTLFSDKKNT